MAQLSGGELIQKEHDSWDAVAKKVISGAAITPAWANEWIPKPYKNIDDVYRDLDKLIDRFSWVETWVTGFNENSGWAKLKNFRAGQKA